MMEVKQTSIRLPKEMLIQIKALAVEKETTQNNIITEFIAKGLKTAVKEPKIKQMPFIDPDKKGNFENSCGTANVENAENLDVNELIDSIHFKKELY
jgi:N-acetylglutamate synthase-like GNAT family acetyltransferase